MITSDTVVAVKNDLAIADLDKEAVLLDSASDQYYGLNQVGYRVLQCAEDRVAVDDIIDRLLEEFDVDRRRLEKDVVSFLQDMERLGLVRTQKESTPSDHVA